MVWEGVPWMVDGGEHSAEVGRLVGYLAANGGEGIISPADCAVVASAIPDGNVHVNTGAVVALNRFPGGSSQSYVMRNVGDDVLALTAQGSSGERYDLVAVIVEDPEYPGQPAPVDPASGPYVRIRSYENVDPATRYLWEVDPDQTGYALARVRFDASDGTVTQSDITDLRELVNPRVLTWKRMFCVTDPAAEASGGTGDFAWVGSAEQVFPPEASWDIFVPPWATKFQVSFAIRGLHVIDQIPGTSDMTSKTYGTYRCAIGDKYTNDVFWITSFNGYVPEWSYTLIDIELADTQDVPEEMRGTVQTFRGLGTKLLTTKHNIGVGWGTTVIADVTFYEDPEF